MVAIKTILAEVLVSEAQLQARVRELGAADQPRTMPAKTCCCCASCAAASCS